MAIAEELRGAFPEPRVATDYPNAGEKIDLILNATSLGLKASDALPFDPEALNLEQASHAYDAVYQPTQTPFLKKAHGAGCAHPMALACCSFGAAALEIWTGPSHRDHEKGPLPPPGHTVLSHARATSALA